MEIKTIKAGVDNCYLVKDKKTILIDGGAPGNFNTFSSRIRKLGVDPKQIETMIITHCHWDHIGCAQKIKEFTGVDVLVHKNEKSILENGESVMPPGVTTWGKILGALLDRYRKKFTISPCKIDIVIEDGCSLDEYGINGQIVFTPGHSPGSICVVLETGDAFVGDMAMNGFPLTLGPNTPIFGTDMSTLRNSWKRLIDMGVTNIYPSHGKPFSIEKLTKKVNFKKFITSTYT